MDFIKVYDNILCPEQCSYYISLIDKGEQVPGKVAATATEHRLQPKVKKSMDVCISSQYPQEAEYLVNLTRDLMNRYRQEFNVRIPMKSCELFSGRVYYENDGFYKSHIDAGNELTMNRTVTILFYLNEVEGGDIEFPLQNRRIKVKSGRVVMFPSPWTHPHIAHMPTRGNRYIMRTFILAID